MGRQGRHPGKRDIEAGFLKNALEFIRQIMHSLIQQTPSAKSSVSTSAQPGCKELGETEPDTDSPKGRGWAGRGGRGWYHPKRRNIEVLQGTSRGLLRGGCGFSSLLQSRELMLNVFALKYIAWVK